MRRSDPVAAPMPLAPVLLRFVDEELALAPALIDRVRAGTLQLLRDTRGSALAPGEAAHQFAVVEALQARGAAYQQAFVEALRSQVRSNLGEPGSDTGAQASGGGLELMDESRVETDIEISRAVQLIDTTAEWELRELQTYTSTLVGQTHVSAESNPFRPLVYAAALWEAACVVSPVPTQRSALLKVSAGVAAGLLRNAWAAACSRLESQGVEPGIYRTVLLAPGTVPSRGAEAAAEAMQSRPGDLARLLARMPGDGAAPAQVSVGQAAIAMGALPSRLSKPPPNPELEQALARLDEVFRHLPAVGAPAREQNETLIRRLNLHRAALAASARTTPDRQAIQLVGRLFDSFLADPQVPAPFVAMLERLQPGSLRVALQDPDLLASVQHPVWQLLDAMAEAGAGYPQANDPRAAALLTRCHKLVESLARAPAPDAALFRHARSLLDSFLAEQLQAQLDAARPAVKALRLAERRETLQQQLDRRIADQMVGMRTSVHMRHFMTGAWAQVIAVSMLRDGEEAESTRGYIKLVDELLWSLRLPDHPQSRQRLVGLLPELLQRLRAGMALINLPAAEQAQVLDELVLVHTEALRPGSREDSIKLSSEQIVQRMRDEIVPPATGHGGFRDSVIDLASLETVPAELLPETPASEAAGKRVDAMRPGHRLRILLQGRWSRVQVLWRSEQGLFTLFAAETAGLTHSVTQRALDRLAAAGLVQPLQARTLVERALDNVSREWAPPA